MHAGRAWFAASLLAVAFASGLAVARWQLPPYELFENGALAIRDWVANWRGYLSGEPFRHIRPARHPGAGVTVAVPDRMAPGLTFFTGAWRSDNGWRLAMRLVSPEGTLLHEWHADPGAIWPVSPHQDGDDTGTSMDRVHMHGAELLPDGSVVFNFSFLGLVKLDACSRIVWKVTYPTHHSVHRSEDGSLWASGRRWVRERRYPGLPLPHAEETVLHVSGDGRILREISVLDGMYRSGYEGLLFATRQDNVVGMREYNKGDILRLNDVEVLEPRLAAAFPMFAAGDIMVSLRQINSVLVLDGETGLVKWSITHPLIHQHDPDFNADGTITVFDNRKDETRDGSILGGSRIVRIDPATRMSTVAYPTTPTSPPFHTNIMGKHQVLPNGNLLIAETESGRAFETTSSGEVVWNYINRWDEGRVGLIEQATRYPPEFVDFGDRPCP